MISLLKTKIKLYQPKCIYKTDIRNYCFPAAIFWFFKVLFTNFIILLKSVLWKNILTLWPPSRLD
jgi:hypothetical protein